MRSQSGERLCKPIVERLASRDQEKHAMLADVEKEDQDVICFDDIPGKELLWHAMRKVRELELKYLRDLGVYEKINETEAVAQYRITPVDTKWVDTDKAFDGGPMQIRLTIGQICMQGLSPFEALKAIR